MSFSVLQKEVLTRMESNPRQENGGRNKKNKIRSATLVNSLEVLVVTPPSSSSPWSSSAAIPTPLPSSLAHIYFIVQEKKRVKRENERKTNLIIIDLDVLKACVRHGLEDMISKSRRNTI